MLGFAVGASYLLAVWSVIRTGIVPHKYFYPVLIVSGLIIAGLVYANLKNTWKTAWKSILLVIVSLIVVFANCYVYSLSATTSNFLANIGSKNSAQTTDITKPYVIYISGIDTYGKVSTVSRSDVNILMVVNPKSHQILLVNTPRDFYVQLHGTTGVRDKLTHAGIYGPEMSKNTMQDLYNTHINYYLRINFTSLTKIIDTLGGVNVYSDYAFTAGKYHFVKGYNKMDGQAALAFARDRHDFADGDRTRGKNQQKVIEAIIAKTNSPQTLVKYRSLLNSLEGSFQTNASSKDVSAILNQQASGLGGWQTKSISVTGTDSHNVTYSMPGVQLYVMEPNVASVNSAKAQIQAYEK